MEKEVDADIIKATQNLLGKHVKRPPLTEKLLKKPPFRFLHDIITTVMKTTGFFEGLFDDDELVSDNVKDRDSKIAFLNKVIAVVGSTTGKTLAVKPSKIVAGQEPDKTNELLQCLATALDSKLSSEEAVKKFREKSLKGESKPSEENKSKESVKTVKKASDTNKLTSKSSEKLTTTTKKETREKSLTRNEKDRIKNVKQKEQSLMKKDSPPKKTSQTKNLTKKNSVEKITQNQTKNDSNKNRKNSVSVPSNVSQNEEVHKNTAENEDTEQVSEDPIKQHEDVTESKTIQQVFTPAAEPQDLSKLNSSYTIGDIDLNSSLSSQDLMEVDNHNSEDKNGGNLPVNEVIATNKSYERNAIVDDDNLIQTNGNSGPPSLKREAIVEQNVDVFRPTKNETSQNVTRPTSVRPSSSRPGAPRLREKHDSIVTGNENLLIGKVNIIAESTTKEEEEESSIVIIEQPADTSTSQEAQDLQLSSNQHGALVQQILESQKEYSQISGKTEIEWQFGAQKAREAMNQEVEQLRFNIQALSRVANPLGKLLDHIQEDVEIMRQELQQWTTSYEEASKELRKQKTANEDSLFPLHTKLKQLNVDIEEKRDKINDLKVVIHKNSSRIEKLLASGNVQ